MYKYKYKDRYIWVAIQVQVQVYVEWRYKCKYTRADTWREEGLKIRGLCAHRVHTEGALGLMGFGRLFLEWVSSSQTQSWFDVAHICNVL